MSDTTKSSSKDDDDIDIYSELPNFKYDENLLKLEGDNKALKSTVAELTKQVETLEIQLKTCEKTNTNYRRNISMLFLSAKREIERKDRTISELRSRSFQNARRDFPRRNRNEATGGQSISRNSEAEKAKTTAATSEPPALNQQKKISYCFTAGNSRSGLYKSQYPVKDNKVELGGKSCKGDDSLDTIKKTDCSKSVMTSGQIGDSKEIRSMGVESVEDRSKVSENRENSSKVTDNIKEDSKGEGEKAEKEQAGTSLQSKSTINRDQSPTTLHGPNLQKNSSRRKSPTALNRRRSPRTASKETSDKRNSSINSSRSKSPKVSNRRRSPINSNRRKSPRISAVRDVGKRSGSSSVRNARSGSVLRKLDHRSRSIQSRSRISSTFRHSGKRDSFSRDVGLRGKSPVVGKNESKECAELDLGRSEVKSVPGTQTMESVELKSVDMVVDNGKTLVDTPVPISSKTDTHFTSVDSGVNVENHGEVIQVSENVIPVEMNTTQTKSPDKSTEEVVNNQTTIENEELERIKSLPPLIGPWTQFSVRRYKKLYGFSPVKPGNEKKKIVNIKCIEKKNLFDNKIERTVVTEIDGKTSKEIINIESDKGLESNKIFESRLEVETSNKTQNVESVKDDTDPNKTLIESNKLLESSSASESCVLNAHIKDMPSISCNINNQKLESGSLILHNESGETLSSANVISTSLESNKDNHSENEVISAAENKSTTELLSDSNIDISHKIVNSELVSVGNLVHEETSTCIGNEKSDDLLSEKCSNSKLSTNNHGNDAPVISITDNNTTISVSVSVKDNSKEIDSCMSGINRELVPEIEKNYNVNSESEADNQCSKIFIEGMHGNATTTCDQLPMENERHTKVENEKEICSGVSEQLSTEKKDNKNLADNQDSTIVIEGMHANAATTTSDQLPMDNEQNTKVDNEKDISSGVSDQLCSEKKDNKKTEQENKSVALPSANVLLTSSTEDEVIGRDKTCCEAPSANLQSSSENEVLDSSVEGQEKNVRLEKLDDVVNATVKEQGINESAHCKEGDFITESAFEKSDSPETDEPPTDKSDSRLTVEKPKIIDNISSSLHTFNSALDFSISTTNTNSLNADSTIEQQRQKAQLSASSLQVVNALKKLPKIRENFLQLFGESSNQDNLKDSGAETPSKRCSTSSSNKEMKSLSCSFSSSSSSTSSSSSSSSSSLITQEKSSESTIPQVIRLFGIDITEEHSPFHVCKSSSQNSILEDKVDDIISISHSTKTENCSKTTTADNNVTLKNQSEIIITDKSDSVVVMGKIDAVSEKKSIEPNCPLAQVVAIESNKISETKIVESSVATEKTVISKEIICEEPVVFPVPIINVVDKVLDDKSINEKKVTPQENKVTGEYYSNFTEALRNETNVSISKTAVTQPEFQFESPSRYIMRINHKSVTSHKGLEMTESQSITGEDTMTMVRRLAKPPDTVSPIRTPSSSFEITESQSVTGEDTMTMVRRLAKPIDTVSPIRTPSKCTGFRNSKTDSSPDDNVVSENKEKQDVKKVAENEKNLTENEKNVVENEKKIAENERNIAENKKKIVENDNKISENVKLAESKNKLAQSKNKLAESKNKVENDRKLVEGECSKNVEHPKSGSKEEMITNLDLIAKTDKVSVSISSEHFAFRRRRSTRPIVKLKNSSISLASRQDDTNKSKTNKRSEQIVDKQATIPSKNDKLNEQKLDKRPTSPSKKDIVKKVSPLASKKDSIDKKQRLTSLKYNPNREKSSQQSPRNDSIEKQRLTSQRNNPKQEKQSPSNDSVEKQRLTSPRNNPKREKQSPRNDSIEKQRPTSPRNTPNQEIPSQQSPRNDSIEKQRPTSPRNTPNQEIPSQQSRRNDSIEKQRLTSPRNTPNQEIPSQQSPKNDSIEDKHLPSPSYVLNKLKRPLLPSRKDTIERTQGFKRRRVVINRFAQNDLIKLGSKNEKTTVETGVKTCEQKDLEKNLSPIASTSELGRRKRLSGSADSKTGVKRINDDDYEQSLGKQLKADCSVSGGKGGDLTASSKDVNKTSQHRHRNQVPESSVLARSNTKVSDPVRSSKRSGATDLKTDFCERRSPSEYFNRRSSMNRRCRGLLRDRTLQRCRSPLLTRRRVDKHLMIMRETRERNETRHSARVAERSVNNDVNRRLNCDNTIEWKLQPIDVKLQNGRSLFERLVAKNVLEKLEKPRTFIIADPMESTPPPTVIPCSRVLVDQSNRSNQIVSSPDLSHCTAQSTHHPDTPKTTNITPETGTSEVTSPKSASKKIVIIRRRSNNTPKVLGDSVGTFVKTNTQVSSSVATEEGTPRAIIIRRERGNMTPRKLEDSPLSQTNLTASSKITDEKTSITDNGGTSSTPNPCNENQSNDLKNPCPVIIRRERGKVVPRKLEDSPRCKANLTESSKLTVEKASSTPNPSNENQGNDSKKEVKNCESNSRVGSIRSTRVVKTQLDFRSRLRRSRK